MGYLQFILLPDIWIKCIQEETSLVEKKLRDQTSFELKRNSKDDVLCGKNDLSVSDDLSRKSIEIAATALAAPRSSYSGPPDGDSALYYFYNLKMLNCSA